MIAKALGRVRGVLAGNYPENREDEQFHITSSGDQPNVFALPELGEASRLGESWISVGTTVNAVSALPTTGAHFLLYNAEPDTGKSYVISHVGCYAGSLTAATNIGVCVCIGTNPLANPLGAIAIRSVMGRQSYRGRGNTKASVTLTTAEPWYPIGNSLVSANTAQSIMNVPYCWNIQGRFVVPPRSFFGVASLVNTGTQPCFPFIVWQEVMLIQG